MGFTFAIIGFAIWPDLCETQFLNYAIKDRPTVSMISYTCNATCSFAFLP